MLHGLDNRLLLHRVSCCCRIFVSLIALVHAYQTLEVFLNSVHLAHDFLEVTLCIIDPRVVITYL